MKKRSRSRLSRGFTLLEILIVIALLGGIMAIVVVNLGDVFGQTKNDLESKKIQSNGSFDLAIQRYRLNVGAFPSTDEGLQALLVAPDGKQDRWKGPYLKDDKALVDGFGKPYGYRYPGTHNTTGYDLWSFGPDQQDGTADDIGNWTK